MLGVALDVECVKVRVVLRCDRLSVLVSDVVLSS